MYIHTCACKYARALCIGMFAHTSLWMRTISWTLCGACSCRAAPHLREKARVQKDKEKEHKDQAVIPVYPETERQRGEPPVTLFDMRTRARYARHRRQSTQPRRRHAVCICNFFTLVCTHQAAERDISAGGLGPSR